MTCLPVQPNQLNMTGGKHYQQKTNKNMSCKMKNKIKKPRTQNQLIMTGEKHYQKTKQKYELQNERFKKIASRIAPRTNCW